MTGKLEVHPDCARRPELDTDTFERLVRDIKRHGQREPIELLDGRIYDGRARYAACLRLGLIPRTCAAPSTD
jgi:ParB-like chromosome segregation protein Spo0J